MEDFIGNEAIAKGLLRVCAQGAPAHGYLFAGPEGVGKHTLAELCAAIALCAQPQDAKACGQCQSCRMYQNGVHPDLLKLSPTEDSPSISIADVRSLRHFLSLTPATGRYKVAIVDDAHTLINEAAHALLKSFEEPPGQSIIILVSAFPWAILPTIRSRAQVVRFHLIPEEQIREFLLKTQPSLGVATSSLCARYASGKPGQGLRFASEPGDLKKEQEQWTDFERFMKASRFDKLGMLGALRDRQALAATQRSWSASAHALALQQEETLTFPTRFLQTLLAADPSSPTDDSLALEAAVFSPDIL